MKRDPDDLPDPRMWPDPWHDRKRVHWPEALVLILIAFGVIASAAWGLATLFEAERNVSQHENRRAD